MRTPSPTPGAPPQRIPRPGALSALVGVLLLAGAAGAEGQVARPAGQRVPTPWSEQEMVNPLPPVDNVWIEELTVLEVRDKLREGMTTALILTGGIESNGPYLTTGKHNHVLKVMGESIARRLGNTLIAPIVTIEPGNPENARSPGGIRYSQETYRAVLRDMAVSLKAQGFTEIFFLGDSGGNRGGMNDVAAELSARWAGEPVLVAHIPEYYNYDEVLTYQRDVLGVDEDPVLATYHDDYYISTIIMNDDPAFVRLQERVAVDLAHINAIPIVPVEKAIWHGRQLIEFRTDLTVAGIEKARAAR